MLPSIIALIVFIILLILIWKFFIIDILTIAINGILIYFFGSLAYHDIKKKNMLSLYLIPGVIGLVIALFVPLPMLWRFTVFVVLTVVVAKISASIKKKSL